MRLGELKQGGYKEMYISIDMWHEEGEIDMSKLA